MFSALTISREYGSGGAAIAREVAEKLGWRLFDRGLLEAAAERAHVDIETASRLDERVEPWWRRVNHSGLWSAAVTAGVPPIEARVFDADQMAAATTALIREFATKGRCVIVGRGAQCVLHDVPSVLKVFVFATWAERLARVQSRIQNCQHVADLLRTVDRGRATYVRRHFQRDWTDPHLYHMMIDSEIGVETAASLIIRVVMEGEGDVGVASIAPRQVADY